MWGWSPDAWTALHAGQGEHTAVTRVDVWHSGKHVYTLAATGGAVQAEAGSPVSRSLSGSLIDPTGQLSRGDAGDLLNAYECEIAPYRGVRLADERDELCPLGVFGLTGKTVADSPDGLTISLTGQDRAMGYQGPLGRSVAISAGTPTEVAIRQLLTTRRPGLSMVTLKTGFTCGPLYFGSDMDAWGEAQKLAQSAGAKLFHDRSGQLVLALAGALSDRPVARYAEGDGLLLDVDRKEDSDTICNVVVAENADQSIQVEVADMDPTSPTYSKGQYGRRVYTLKNPYFSSVRQAQQAAATRLAYELGRSETVRFTAAPNPGLDVDEVVTVHRPRAGLVDRGLVVASLDIPLNIVEGDAWVPMQVGCRQSRLAQDGRVLDEPPELAA